MMDRAAVPATSFDPDFSAKLPQDVAFGPFLHPVSPTPGTPFCRSEGLSALPPFRKPVCPILNCDLESSAQELLTCHSKF
jgi:hypothetical protein